MANSPNLVEAAHALAEHFGARFAGSRMGGRQQLVAVLRTRFSLADLEAEQLIRALERAGVISWIGRGGLPGACPNLLELCGTWHLSTKMRVPRQLPDDKWIAKQRNLDTEVVR